ncbi:MAG TPA: hypothetical protein VI814_15455 [Candidatus Limnocylindria bacterium]
MTDAHGDTLVLQEFRLSAIDTDGTVAGIVAATSGRRVPAVPLLTSIDDRHDVATVERMRDGDTSGPGDARRALLDPFVTSWQRARPYVPRIAEQSLSPPTHYRLAVTESGINDEKRQPDTPSARRGAPDTATSPVDLLWIGQPIGSYAGLLILLGNHGVDPPTDGARDWPLLMSRRLGIRVYDSRP